MTIMPQPTRKNIAVIGSGVAGLTTAYLLDKHYDVTLFERNDYAGGHTNTVELTDGPDRGLAIDTGFIVLNDQTYPLFRRLLARLGVPTQDSDMSFAFASEVTGLQYAGTDLGGLFAQRRNLINPRFYHLLHHITRFCKMARADLYSGRLTGRTMGDYLDFRNVSAAAVHNYIVPMAGAIWSASAREIRAFPAETLIRFWANHGLLSLKNRPQWMTVQGGSQAYVKQMRSTWNVRLHLNTNLEHVRRQASGVILRHRDGREQSFDAVVLAAHADESLRLLADPSADEQRLLGPWRYQPNHTVLHTDRRVMPSNRRAWASWNYVERPQTEHTTPVAVTYHMNRLQNLATSTDYFVTLNDTSVIARDKILREFIYHHPTFTFDSLATQSALPTLNGVRNTYFCGSYFGYGFHEDAVRSAVAVAENLGAPL
jgi:predicted NAD/FAD-binding protein